MTKFTFSEYDIGNSPIVPDQEGSISFTISTERSFMDQPKKTTLISSGDNALGGVMDWKKKTLQVGGITKPLAEVKRKTGGVFSTYVILSQYPSVFFTHLQFQNSRLAMDNEEIHSQLQ
jgi:hypothetical protein